jgi:L-iduronidase
MNAPARQSVSAEFKAVVHADRPRGPMHRFWRATGFSPAELLLDPDMQQSLITMATLPERAIEYVRIHYLFNLVRVERLAEDGPVFDFTLLDQGLDVLVHNGLKPVFELMGNPGDHFRNFIDPPELQAWRRLVRETAARYIDRYGADEVRAWYFESWNEVDQAKWWPHGEAAFCAYFDACSEGLRDVDAALRLGGPGSARTLAPMFRSFMAHCADGKNYFTGEPVRIDFISVHEKGARASREDLTPDLDRLCDREQQALDYIAENHPGLVGKPFVNDECDPQIGWSDIHSWHARPYYAAWICRLIDQHIRRFVDKGVPYELLSNDHAFMGGWGNRTLFALFGGKEKPLAQSQHRPMLPPLHGRHDGFPPFALVKKPVLNAMAMLAYLEGERLTVDAVDNADIAVLATRRSDGALAILVHHGCDELWRSDLREVRLRIGGLNAPHMLCHWRIDTEHGDPYRLWDRWDGPAYPSEEELAALRARQEIAPAAPDRIVEPQDGVVEIAFALPLPGVSLLHLVPRPPMPPAAPRGLRVHVYPALNGGEDALVSWQHATGTGPLRYEVLAAPGPSGPFAPIATPLLTGAAWLDPAPARAGRRAYQVRAIDAWGTVSAPSDPVMV